MATQTGVTEGPPQEPVNPVLTQAEPADVELVTVQLVEVRPADTEAAEAEPADTEPVEAGLADTESVGAGRADTEPVEAELADAGATETELAEAESARDISPLAVVGVVLGVIALVGIAVGVLAVSNHHVHKKTVVTYRPAAVYRLRPGDCVDSGGNGLSFTLLSCSQPHNAEVFATFALTGSSWPGDAAVQQDAGNGCADRLGAYLNPQLANAGLAQEYIYPNKSAWQDGERSVVCEVSSPTGPLTGSVRKAS
jgi:putative regulator of septum formation